MDISVIIPVYNASVLVRSEKDMKVWRFEKNDVHLYSK